MDIPVRPKDLLSNFVSDTRNKVWARDLVCLAIRAGGLLSEDDKYLIWSECCEDVMVPSQTIPSGFGSPFPKVELLKLTHVNGVNALASNQDIVFCDEGVTLLYGQNRSGKSGYFRILNQLSNNIIKYPLHSNIFCTAPPSIEIILEYRVDGMQQPAFRWNGESTCPLELRHIRCFDSQYAASFLKPRDGNTYLFDSYNLRIFRAIYEALESLKDDMGAEIDEFTEASLKTLCTTAYMNMLCQALIDAFNEELKLLGMENLRVNLCVDNLLSNKSQIAISLFNQMSLDAVLSEAELKCAALALFLAECDLMEVKQPIIFDDPVNSLDASIIQNFGNRIKNIDNEIVVFTHNVLLMEALTDERQFKVYNNPSINRIGAKTSRKHILAYDVLTSANAVGYVSGRSERKTLFYLGKAQEKLSASPVSDHKGIVDDLRMAVEWCIDEVVFRGLPTRRFKGSELTDWITMENMANAGPNNVRDLKANYDQLNGLGCHLGYSSYSSLPSPATLQSIHDNIMRIYRTVYQL